MSKRLTDSNKWRNEWFRTLPLKAKLAWTYLCDECDFAGIWKADWGLASFQLDFKLTPDDLAEWFGNKVHFFGGDNVLVVPFFEFQYGQSKDSWTAKIKAQERLTKLGFNISDNQIVLNHSGTTVPPQSGDCLSVCVSECVGNKGGVGEKRFRASTAQLEALYKAYPRKKGKEAGIEKLRERIKSPAEIEAISSAILKFRDDMKTEKRAADKIPYFSTFVNQQLADYLDPEAHGPDEDFSENGDRTEADFLRIAKRGNDAVV